MLFGTRNRRWFAVGRGFLTEEDVKILNNNPNVLYAMENRIIYSPAFKAHFIKEYQNGKRPGTIFKEAGFDTKMLGSKRIERASARWREAHRAGALTKCADDYLGYKSAEQKKLEKCEKIDRSVNKLTDEIKRLQSKIEKYCEKIEKLQDENRRLRKGLRYLSVEDTQI